MDNQTRDQLILDAPVSKSPEIGQWLAAIQDSRRRTLEQLEGLTTEIADWMPAEDVHGQPPRHDSNIGTVLYHIADIEADWLYAEVLVQDFPPEVADLFPYPTRDAEGNLTQVIGVSLEEHFKRLETVRGLLLGVYQQMDITDFRRLRTLPSYDVTPEWVLHHLMQHEAEHRSMMASLLENAKAHFAA